MQFCFGNSSANAGVRLDVSVVGNDASKEMRGRRSKALLFLPPSTFHLFLNPMPCHEVMRAFHLYVIDLLVAGKVDCDDARPGDVASRLGKKYSSSRVEKNIFCLARRIWGCNGDFIAYFQVEYF